MPASQRREVSCFIINTSPDVDSHIDIAHSYAIMSPNIFHLFADISHVSSKAILIWAIHNNKSAEGVSLLTQLLYLVVFVTRYLDLFYTHPAESWLGIYLTVLKIAYISTSSYIIFLMMRVFARTREKEYAWKLATWSLMGSFLAAPVVTYIVEKGNFTFNEVGFPMTSTLILGSLTWFKGYLDIQHCARIRLHPPTAPSLAPNECSNSI